MKLSSIAAATLGVVAVVTGWVKVAQGPKAGPVPNTTVISASWHPADWDTALPPGINAVRPDGRRIVPDQDPTAKDYCPGEVDTSVTQAQLDSPQFIEDSRNVSAATKKFIYARDGVPYPPPADKPDEIDHDISICLTGTEGVHNLWCQPRYGPWNAYIKDKVESKLHRMNKADPTQMTPAMVADDIRGYHWIWSALHFLTPDELKQS